MKSTNEKQSGATRSIHRIGRFLRNVRRKGCELHRATLKLLTTDIWDIEITTLPALKRRVLRTVRIFFLVGRGFKNDECGLHASSLTFMTLLSFVPILALAISVVRTVSYDASMRDRTKAFVRSLVVEMPSTLKQNGTNGVQVVVVSTGNLTRGVEGLVAEQNALASTASSSSSGVSVVVEAGEGVMTLSKIEALIDVGFDRVEQLNYGALGGIGLLFLIWAVISVLGDVEAAFNKVWGVVEERTFARKFTDYLSVLIICPLLGVAASSLPVMSVIEAKMNEVDKTFFLSSMAGVPVIRVIWVVFLLTLAFTFLLRFTPNTNVRLSPGLIGGLVSALGFAAWLKICLLFQVGVAKYSTFLGSFATVPILLSWVYVSWEILLFGGEVSYAVQNVDTYRMELGWREASQKARILLAVALMREAARSMAKGNGLLNLPEFIRRYRISARLVREVAYDLTTCGIIVETAADSECYAVCRHLDSMDVGDLVGVLLNSGVKPSPLGVGALTTSSVVEKEIEAVLKARLTTKIVDLPENVPVGGA